MFTVRRAAVACASTSLLLAGAILTLPTTAQAAPVADPPSVISEQACAGGYSVVSVHRSTTFNPETATSDQLAANYLPNPPTDTAQRAVWKHYVTNPIVNLTSCSDIKVQQRPTSAGTKTINGTASPAVTSSNSAAWAGNVATGQSWTQAQATWNVPVITGGSSAALSSQWAGVGQGRVATAPLYQAGTEANVATGYNVWTEVVPQQSYAQVQRYPAVNDQIWVRVSNTASGAQFQISDQSKGWSITINWNGGHQSSDGTAEFIDERPLVGGYHSEYATQNTTFKGVTGLLTEHRLGADPEHIPLLLQPDNVQRHPACVPWTYLQLR